METRSGPANFQQCASTGQSAYVLQEVALSALDGDSLRPCRPQQHPQEQSLRTKHINVPALAHGGGAAGYDRYCVDRKFLAITALALPDAASRPSASKREREKQDGLSTQPALGPFLLAGPLIFDGGQSRLRKFEQVDKWSFCLTAGTL